MTNLFFQELERRLDGMPSSSTERELRRLLAVRVAMPHTYFDDGEASGQEHGIVIDFMREPVSEIDAKLRSLNAARATTKSAKSGGLMADKNWSVFNGAGAVIADECTFSEAEGALPDDAFERGWTLVHCVVIKTANELSAAKSAQVPPQSDASAV